MSPSRIRTCEPRARAGPSLRRYGGAEWGSVDDAEPTASESRGSKEKTEETLFFLNMSVLTIGPLALGANRDARFGEDFDTHFKVPWRLADKSSDLVEAVNDFHFAMINDIPRNEFYRECLRRAIVPGESVVLEIGTGSGLLAMIAARLGARKVVAIEASVHMAELARRNVAANGLSDVVTVLEKLSTEVTAHDIRIAMGTRKAHAVASISVTTAAAATVAEDEDYRSDMPDVLVSELLGTLLLGESVLDYVADARRRLIRPGCKVVPPRGVQYAAVVECADVEALTSARDWGGFKLNNVNVLQDTASLVFTKQYGFRFSSVPSRRLAEAVPVFAVDFSRDGPGFMPRTREIRLEATGPGTAHCVVIFWECLIGKRNPPTQTRPLLETAFEPEPWELPDRPLVMSTCPVATQGNFARDMQWGQGIQLLEDVDAATASKDHLFSTLPQPPVPFAVRASGEALLLECRLSTDSVVLQFELRRLPLLPRPPETNGNDTMPNPTHTRFTGDDDDGDLTDAT